MKSTSSASKLLPSGDAAQRRHRIRTGMDTLTRYGIGFGGISVIIAITLIFFYLAWVVIPLFKSAEIDQSTAISIPGEGSTVFYSVEEQAEMAIRVSNNGKLYFFNLADGVVNETLEIPIPDGATITSISQGDQSRGDFVVAFDNGYVYAGRIVYKVSYPENKRTITPRLVNLIGANAVPLIGDEQLKIKQIGIEGGEEGFTIVAQLDDNRVVTAGFVVEESMFEDEVNVEQSNGFIEDAPENITRFLINKEQDRLSILDEQGTLSIYDISDKESPEVIESVDVSEGADITDIRYMAGSVSFLIAHSNGKVSQWFGVRDQSNVKHLSKIREFDVSPGGSIVLAPEFFRKSFMTLDDHGNISLFHATAERNLITESVSSSGFAHGTFAPRANYFLAENKEGQLKGWTVHNEHPEISWHSLWQKVWYEGYQKPEYIWQSSSASNDFEPKYSLVPISFGTLKAAFYAMLLAMPLAILGAIYAAYFMSPKLRQAVKPSIEIMEALPTVILGFLAGLWLAPFLEDYLPAVFTLIIAIPLGIIFVSLIWSMLPREIRGSVPDGWMPLILIPIIAFISWAAISASPYFEAAWFGGDMPKWLKYQMGIDFDQRNSLVVGLAMGFAVIPTIFSIAEDAIFSVPKHLTNGSLALGATPWQTLVRVVLPTASPGIFSGVMIGFGRAVGETMIVLMATGNTPVMDMSIFQGMRTLSANIAVEMPESEVHSTHYRILFLAALVLFVFTFLFNTMAELVRQRLREKYSSI